MRQGLNWAAGGSISSQGRKSVHTQGVAQAIGVGQAFYKDNRTRKSNALGRGGQHWGPAVIGGTPGNQQT